MIQLKNNLKKTLLILSLTSIIIALFIAIIIPPYTNYELNLYAVYPWYFWTLLSTPYLLSFIVLYFDEDVNNYTYLMLVSAQFALIILLLIPVFRGYPFYGAGDTQSHLGMIKDLYTGHIGSLNPYPIIHLIIFEMSKLTNINPNVISLFIPVIFTNLYIVSMFILSRSLELSKKESLFVYLFATIPVFGALLTVEDILPSTQFFLFIPLVLYVLLKSRFYNNKLSYSVILVLLLVLLAFAHPETTLFFIIIILILIFVIKYLNYFKNYNLNGEFLNPLLILIIAMFAWFSSTLIFSNTVQSVFNIFIQNLNPVPTPLSQLDVGIKITLIDALNVIIHEYGSALIYLAISGILSLFIIKNYLFKKEITFRNLFLSCLLFGFIVLNLIFLLKGTAIGYSVYRQIKYPLLISTIFMAIFVYRLSKRDKISKIKIYFPFTMILMLIVVLISLGGLYPSPSVQNINHQPTYSDIAGMSYVLENNENINILELSPNANQQRYADYLFGYESSLPNSSMIYSESIVPPPHFGYDVNSSIGDSYKKPQYLLIYPPFEDYYQAIYPKYPNLWRYSPEDFEKIENDDLSSELIYNNGEFKIFFIKPNIT